MSVPDQLNSLTGIDSRQIEPGMTKRGSKRVSNNRTERGNRFHESNESLSLSLSYILLCKSLALSSIESIFGMEVPWTPVNYLVAMVTQLTPLPRVVLTSHLVRRFLGTIDTVTYLTALVTWFPWKQNWNLS